MVILFAVSCKKPAAPITSSNIRKITREFVLAARNATSGRAEVGMRPQYAPRESGAAQSLASDHIYITVPLKPSGQADIAARDAIENELARVATFHKLERRERPGAPGLERFDYFSNGRLTQSIHLITPFESSKSSASPSPHSARLAVVIDDLGYDSTQAAQVFQLVFPLTLSVLPSHASSAEIAEEAHRRRYQVLLHLPMESNAGAKDEPVELRPGMDPAAVQRMFASMLETVPYAEGVNNHEGSLGSSNLELMNELMPLLRQEKLFFVDSRTASTTVAESAAHAAGVRATSRNVFLDDDPSADSVRKQFALAVRDAKEKGSALAIGHPHPETLAVLAEMLPEAEREGITLVHASDLVH